MLPALRAGRHAGRRGDAGLHETKPPARYTEAGLVQKMEELGIGRPSTYASIIATILDREYARSAAARWSRPAGVRGRAADDALAPTLVDYSFTAEMEGKLDEIARGELERRTFLDDFYRGDQPGLHTIVTEHVGRSTRSDVGTIPLGEKDGQAGRLRVGRYGPYIEYGGSARSVPEGMAPDEITIDKAIELMAAASKADEPIGHAADGLPVYLRTGRFGPYVQLGDDPEDKKVKPKRASLFKSMEPDT